jgi:hypothetical protein
MVKNIEAARRISVAAVRSAVASSYTHIVHILPLPLPSSSTLLHPAPVPVPKPNPQSVASHPPGGTLQPLPTKDQFVKLGFLKFFHQLLDSLPASRMRRSFPLVSVGCARIFPAQWWMSASQKLQSVAILVCVSARLSVIFWLTARVVEPTSNIRPIIVNQWSHLQSRRTDNRPTVISWEGLTFAQPRCA